MQLKQFKLYRWWKGGRWVRSDGVWWPVKADNWVDHPGHGYHIRFLGIEKREIFELPPLLPSDFKYDGNTVVCSTCSGNCGQCGNQRQFARLQEEYDDWRGTSD